MLSKLLKGFQKRGTAYFGFVAVAMLIIMAVQSGSVSKADIEDVIEETTQCSSSSRLIVEEIPAGTTTVPSEIHLRMSEATTESESTVAETTVAETTVAETTTVVNYCKTKEVPNEVAGCRSEFKAYMSYKAVSDTSSPQYKLLNGASAYTDEASGIRMVDGRYCVAVGSYYAQKVGTKLDLQLSSGEVIPCILGDCKSDSHTDESNRFCMSNGGVAEFIVDYSVFKNVCDSSGTVNFVKGFSGEIESISIVE